MGKKVFQDDSGLYRLDCISSIHPVPIKGDRHDQTKVTAIHTAISTVGGQTHSTSIPFDDAKSAFLELFEPAPPQQA